MHSAKLSCFAREKRRSDLVRLDCGHFSVNTTGTPFCKTPQKKRQCWRSPALTLFSPELNDRLPMTLPDFVLKKYPTTILSTPSNIFHSIWAKYCSFWSEGSINPHYSSIWGIHQFISKIVGLFLLILPNFLLLFSLPC